MTREEAIKVLGAELKERSDGYYSYLAHYGKQDKAEEEFLDSLDMAISALREQRVRDATKTSDWISVGEATPDQFVSVLGYMTDAGEFPPVRECYLVGGAFFFPALRDIHPVSHWMPMPSTEGLE